MNKKSIKRPPKIPSWLLCRLKQYQRDYFILGDLEESFNETQLERNYAIACLWFWYQAIACLPKYVKNQLYWDTVMLKNYLIITLRNLKKYKVYSFINIFSLAVGIACCLLMGSYVLHELSYESMHPLKDRIFRINGRIPYGDNVLLNAVVGAPLGPTVKESLYEIEDFVRFKREHDLPVQVGNNDFVEDYVLVAEQNVFDMFSMPLLIGDPNTALRDPYTVVINETLAQKYFGDQNPVGQIIRIPYDKTYDFRITGVMKNMPSNTVLNKPMLISFATISQLNKDSLMRWESWGWATTFVLLREGAHPEEVSKKITLLAQKFLPEDEKDASYYLQPLKKIYIDNARLGMNNDLDNTGSVTRIYLFSLIAVLILSIAVINFINLSTAKIAAKMKEVAIQKTCGAVRPHLIWRFLLESIILTTLAMGAGLILFSQFKPFLEQYLNKSLSLSISHHPLFIPGLIVMMIVLGLLAGAYPAIFLSRFPAAVIFNAGMVKGSSKSRLRWILVGSQFFIANALIICTLVVLKQVRYFETKDLGFESQNRIVLSNSNARLFNNASFIKNQLLNRTGVLAVSSLGNFPNAQNRSISSYWLEGKRDEKGIIVQTLAVDENFVKTMGLTITAGRPFLSDRPSDEMCVLINESAARRFGFENPVGEYLFGNEKSYKIIGVLKDWNTNSIHSNIYPTVIHRADETATDLLVQLPAANSAAVLDKMKEVWRELLPGQIFNAVFVEDLLLRAYDQERRLANLLVYFCMLTVFVACMGIFGLASYTIEQRTKEIGIRKVMGASLFGIVKHLISKYAYRVLIAFICASPVGYYFAHRWLQSFAYQTPIGVSPFVFTIAIVLSVTLLSITFQAVKAAMANPVDSLRYE